MNFYPGFILLFSVPNTFQQEKKHTCERLCEQKKSSGDVTLSVDDSPPLPTPELFALLFSHSPVSTKSHLIWPDMSGKDGREMKEVKTKRSAETEGTEDVKKKKVEQPGKFSVSNCTSAQCAQCTAPPSLLFYSQGD